jgi:chromate transporter
MAAYAIGQMTPGPGVAFVVPLGYLAAGVPGALVALIAYFGPAAAIALTVAHLWGRIRTSPWPTAFRTGMMPIVMGLTLGSAYTMGLAGLGNLQTAALAAGAFLVLRTKIPTAFVVLGAGAVGAALTAM